MHQVLYTVYWRVSEWVYYVKRRSSYNNTDRTVVKPLSSSDGTEENIGLGVRQVSKWETTLFVEWREYLKNCKLKIIKWFVGEITSVQ